MQIYAEFWLLFRKMNGIWIKILMYLCATHLHVHVYDTVEPHNKELFGARVFTPLYVEALL